LDFYDSPSCGSLLSLSLSSLSVVYEFSERADEDVLREFFRDRQLNGDIITKYSDRFFKKEVMRVIDDEAADVDYSSQPNTEALTDEPDAGFLKLTTTQEWLMGETSAPINRKPTNKLKRELQFMTLGIGAACTGYCLFIFSIQAAVSYASGVGFRIGIRSEDLRDSLEKSVKGSGIALSSPRLVIPAAIYGTWVLLHQNFATDLFDFQIVPAMLGLFAYKAAALVQVYRDNEDLQFIFPDTEESSGV
uniref:CGL160/ATPI domain-containing protein n=1 Tax=Chenopodium quinoa TaxID=63459 RepID=A0A803LRT2_CHEQI